MDTSNPIYSRLAVTAGATAVSWLPQLDLIMRIGASLVAIISGSLCIIYYARKLREDK